VQKGFAVAFIVANELDRGGCGQSCQADEDEAYDFIPQNPQRSDDARGYVSYELIDLSHLKPAGAPSKTRWRGH